MPYVSFSWKTKHLIAQQPKKKPIKTKMINKKKKKEALIKLSLLMLTKKKL
jgi:hypothetical protein